MLGILIDAAILILLLKMINNDDMPLSTAFFLALGASIGSLLLTLGLAALLGIAGVFLAAIVAAVLLGVAVSATSGAEIKRSFLIGGLFMLAHLGVGFGLGMMLG